jgi:hypothetical protein
MLIPSEKEENLQGSKFLKSVLSSIPGRTIPAAQKLSMIKE